MTTKKTAISTAMLAMLMIGAPAGAAFAAKQPPEAELSARAAPPAPTEQAVRRSQSAQASAEQHRQKLDELRRLGGAAYKGGLIREHEWQVAKLPTDNVSFGLPKDIPIAQATEKKYNNSHR